MLNQIKDLKQQAKIARGIIDKKILTGPWSVQIDLTNKCNNDCLACWCHSPLLGEKAMTAMVKKKFLTYETAIKLIDDLDDLGVRDIYFTGGGEPFMHPRILDIMRHIKSKGMHLDMSTNFTLVNEKVADELIDLGMDHMNLSLWAGTPETYAKQHPNKSPETFVQMTNIIDYIQKRKHELGVTKPALGMYNVITKYNYHEVNTMLEFAYQHKMQDIDFTPVDTVPEATDILALTKEDRIKLADLIRRMKDEMPMFERKYNHKLEFKNWHSFLRRTENPEADEANYDGDILDQLPSCYAGWTFARVLATGDVNSCLKSFKIPVGNIYEKSFKDIWFGKKQSCFRKHTIDYDKKNPYFKNMGNDLATEGQGCYKICDNLGFNLLVHEKITKLKKPQKGLLKIARYV